MSEIVTISSGDLRVEILDTGATLMGVWVPDRNGEVANVVLRHDDIDAYRDPSRNPYLGSMVGRYTNRILGSTIDIDGQVSQLLSNEGTTSLHGGPDGWSFRQWKVVDHDASSVTLSIVSPDGDMGFPGEVTASVRYQVDAIDGAGSSLQIDAWATTDVATVISMTNHAYWNLAGRGTIDGHVLSLGPIERSWDDWFMISPTADPATHPAAVLTDPRTGRRMELSTSSPGLQLYTADSLGWPFGPRAGVCLEASTRPNSAAHCIVRPGETYRWSCRHDFSFFPSVS